ncbi:MULTISPECIES: ABC transporter ATP-binding protein [unclassified Sinorhizobium]|uniref:ABC transporter ATP-binding protein n=1 Tax=unclassified Sinorhizobium TaxID=2613772 RepID=UPI0024C30989|nr:MULTISPECIES: ABC transporter ATP-binding protein [unclassified Sinorhizobium]MDK1378145.1 ABC transporter ATP-binding protein [Sinorhizobium sp. 6-70]MDK1479806.1 ABC transporter ATP-binding protein [Sinorhizobium sp. 6-117]
MSGLELRNICKNFGSTNVIRNLSLDVVPGEFLTLLGPSGCGKSTLLRIIAGLELQDEGSVAIGGRAVDGLRPKRRDVAMVFQSYALYPHMSVARNLAIPLLMRRLNTLQRLPVFSAFVPGTAAKKAEIASEVARIAKSIGIDHLLDRKPSQLSGGQRQRVAVGRAMVRQPAVFLMDEPLSNLDAKLRVQMRAEIKELHQRLGVTFIYVTHDQVEAMTLSDRVAVMLDGELLQVAPPQEIYTNPHDRRVAEFVGSPKINMIDVKVREGGLAKIGGQVLPLEFDAKQDTLTIGIRPEAFRLTDSRDPNSLSSIVRLIEHMGSDLFVHVDLSGVPDPVIARLPAWSSHIAPGSSLHLRITTEQVLLFSKDGKRLKPQASVTPLRGLVR